LALDLQPAFVSFDLIHDTVINPRHQIKASLLIVSLGIDERNSLSLILA
jgi:hypothetical protein